MLSTEDKYYTPEIEEFHVGFECEIKNNPVKSIMDWWVETTIKEGYSLESYDVRVKYLDKQDIESFGFEYNEFYSRGFYGYTNNKKSLMVAHQFIDNPEDITKVTILKDIKTCHLGGSLWEPIFVGTIKNKEELKKVLKMIGCEDN